MRLFGLAGVIHETVINDVGERPWLLGLFAAMMVGVDAIEAWLKGR